MPMTAQQLLALFNRKQTLQAVSVLGIEVMVAVEQTIGDAANKKMVDALL